MQGPICNNCTKTYTVAIDCSHFDLPSDKLTILISVRIVHRSNRNNTKQPFKYVTFYCQNSHLQLQTSPCHFFYFLNVSSPLEVTLKYI